MKKIIPGSKRIGDLFFIKIWLIEKNRGNDRHGLPLLLKVDDFPKTTYRTGINLSSGLFKHTGADNALFVWLPLAFYLRRVFSV